MKNKLSDLTKVYMCTIALYVYGLCVMPLGIHWFIFAGVTLLWSYLAQQYSNKHAVKNKPKSERIIEDPEEAQRVFKSTRTMGHSDSKKDVIIEYEGDEGELCEVCMGYSSWMSWFTKYRVKAIINKKWIK